MKFKSKTFTIQLIKLSAESNYKPILHMFSISYLSKILAVIMHHCEMKVHKKSLKSRAGGNAPGPDLLHKGLGEGFGEGVGALGP